MDNFAEIATRSEEYELIEREAEGIVNGMDTSGLMYCSFDPKTPEEKKRMYNAISGEGLPIIEHTAKPIAVVDVTIQPVKLSNDDGSTSVCPRISVIAADGAVYVATSWGLYRAFQRVNALFGTLHFDPKSPLMVEAVRVKTKKGQTINLKLL